MIVARGENYKLSAYRRKENSPYEWEDSPFVFFKGRPASKIEQSKYRVQKGANGNTDSTYVVASNLPESLKPGDKVEFLGKEWEVESTGYFLEDSRLVNASLFSEEYIIKRCPKGVALK